MSKKAIRLILHFQISSGKCAAEGATLGNVSYSMKDLARAIRRSSERSESVHRHFPSKRMRTRLEHNIKDFIVYPF